MNYFLKVTNIRIRKRTDIETKWFTIWRLFEGEWQYFGEMAAPGNMPDDNLVNHAIDELGICA